MVSITFNKVYLVVSEMKLVHYAFISFTLCEEQIRSYTIAWKIWQSDFDLLHLFCNIEIFCKIKRAVTFLM